MKEQGNKEISNPDLGEKEVQKQHKDLEEHPPQIHPHGEPEKEEELTPREHPHEIDSPVNFTNAESNS